MGVDTLFVVDKRGIFFLSALDKVANLLTKLEMLGMGTVELIGESSEEAIAVAERWGSIQAEGFETGVKQIGIGHGV